MKQGYAPEVLYQTVTGMRTDLTGAQTVSFVDILCYNLGAERMARDHRRFQATFESNSGFLSPFPCNWVISKKLVCNYWGAGRGAEAYSAPL